MTVGPGVMSMDYPVRASLDQFTLDHPSGGGALTISVAAPTSPSHAKATPVLYVIDGDVLFGLAAEIARVMSKVGNLPAILVVGIGYDASYADVLKVRTADLTPPVPDAVVEAMGAVGTAIGAAQNGGADAFLAFLTDRLKPEIAARYPETVNGESIVFGHSLGGLFAAHALLSRPDSFSVFLISSPSLWWGDFALFRQLSSFGERLAPLPLRPRVFVDVGGKEQELPESVPDGIGIGLEEARAQIRAARMVDAAREFAGALGEAGIADLRHIAFADEDHVSVAPAAIVHGLRFALERVK